MYVPIYAGRMTLCNTVTTNDEQIVCPTPTEEMGIYATNVVIDAAGPIVNDPSTTWLNYMILLDPVRSDSDGGPLTQFRYSFAYTDYSYKSGDNYSADGSSASEVTGPRISDYGYVFKATCLLIGFACR